jgi:hypothetical protein
MKKIISVSFLILLGACASRFPLFSSPLVSMTKYSFSEGTLSEIGPVEARYCHGDRAQTSTAHNIGLIDEAIYKAQQQTGADYISNAMISAEGSCVVIEGMAVRKVAASNKVGSLDKKSDRTPAGMDPDEASDYETVQE